MAIHGQLRGVERELIRDLKEATISVSQLAKKYGVSRQTIYGFIGRKGVKRPAREHTKQCSICQGLIRIARKQHSDFLASHTIREELGVGKAAFFYHIRILRSKRLVSQKFGKLYSRRAERAYQIYFKKRIPVRTIGKLVGLKNFWSIIRKHKDLGWNVPAPLFTYNSKDRRRSAAKRIRRKKQG